MLAECCRLLDELQTSSAEHGLVLLGTTSRLASIHPSLLRAGRLGVQVPFPAPSRTGRQHLLRHMLSSLGSRLDPECRKPEVQAAMAASTPGFVAADIERLCQQAVLLAVRRQAAAVPEPALVTAEDFAQARCSVRPSLLAEMRTATARHVSLAELVGMDGIVAAVQCCVRLPLQRPQLYRQAGFGSPGGVLLHGPPGVGKTSLALAVAHGADNNTIVVDATAVRSKVVGQSEAALHHLFQLALDSQPCVLLIDQLEMLAPRHLPSSDPSSVRLLATLLAELDRARGADIVVMATTQELSAVDSRLLSGSRFDQLVHVPLPDHLARQALLQHFMASMPVPEPRAALVAQLVTQTEGYSAADLRRVCQEAALAALRADLVDAQTVAHHQFHAALRRSGNGAVGGGGNIINRSREG